MGFYARYVLPKVCDFAMRQGPIERQREKVVPRARGRVLEVGIGSGLNLPHYDRQNVEKVWGFDPSLELQQMARQRAASAGIAVEWLPFSSDTIPLEDASMDTVLITYTLCSIPDAASALGEMRRVLRPGGAMWFAEHGRAPDAGVARLQDYLTPIWKRIGGGCHLNRAIADLIRDAGFELREMETAYLPGPRPMTFNYWGMASRT